MAWAEQLDQPHFFLKLDFSKAYDMVEWSCLFRIMEKMDFPQKFITMVNLLFIEATASIKLNAASSPSFQIQCGVH